jgi:hypothetical protein
MPTTVLSIVENVLTDVRLPNDGSGKITVSDVLRYIYEAEQEFNDLVLILKTSSLVQAIADQVEYDLPSNFKTNLFNIEHNYLSLLRQSKEFFDLYDSSWRDPEHIATLSLTPKYYATHLVEEGKFLVWPPPSESGESQNIRGPGGGLKRTVTFDGTAYNLRGSSGGLKRTITVSNETFNLKTDTGGIVKNITPRANNFFIEYIKEPDTFSSEGNIEPQLEKYTKAIEDYCKFKIFARKKRKEQERDTFEAKFYNKAERVKINIMRARPKHPLGFKPVFDRSGLGTKEVYIST